SLKRNRYAVLALLVTFPCTPQSRPVTTSTFPSGIEKGTTVAPLFTTSLSKTKPKPKHGLPTSELACISTVTLAFSRSKASTGKTAVSQVAAAVIKSNRLDILVSTFKSRCEIYPSINEVLINLDLGNCP